MKITILCSSSEHPVNAWLERWTSTWGDKHEIEIIREKLDMSGGDLLFLVSCSSIVKKEERQSYKKALVIHASDLPRGRGWSPHVWEILDGGVDICVTLLEVEDKVDSGDVWEKINIKIPKDALNDEINKALFDAELELMNYAILNFETIIPQKQSSSVKPSYYPRRSPENSRVDPSLSIEQQFDLIRVCDPERFPAFFEIHGKKYKIKLEKL